MGTRHLYWILTALHLQCLLQCSLPFQPLALIFLLQQETVYRTSQVSPKETVLYKGTSSPSGHIQPVDGEERVKSSIYKKKKMKAETEL